jgi:hypothetical protein
MVQFACGASNIVGSKKMVKALYRCAQLYASSGDYTRASYALRGCLGYDRNNETVNKAIVRLQHKGLEQLSEVGTLTSLHACRKTTCAGKYEGYFDFKRL